MMLAYGRKTVFSLVIVAAALAGCSASSAGTGDTSSASAAETARVAAVAPNAKSGRVRMIANVLSTVALTDDQRTAIEALASEADARHAAEAQAHKDILLTLAGQVEAGAIDRAALQPKIDAATAAMSANHPADQAALQKLHALLTPEQRGKVADALESRHKGMVHDHEHGPGAGGHHDHLAKLADDLKLTDAQKAQVAAAFAAKHAEHAADFKAMHEAHEAGGGGHGQHFAESFRSETLTFPAPPAGHEDHAGKMADHFIGMAEVILPILTPEQRTLAAAKLRERAAAGEGGPLAE